jgi:hypothetical protein
MDPTIPKNGKETFRSGQNPTAQSIFGSVIVLRRPAVPIEGPLNPGDDPCKDSNSTDDLLQSILILQSAAFIDETVILDSKRSTIDLLSTRKQ